MVSPFISVNTKHCLYGKPRRKNLILPYTGKGILVIIIKNKLKI